MLSLSLASNRQIPLNTHSGDLETAAQDVVVVVYVCGLFFVFLFYTTVATEDMIINKQHSHVRRQGYEIMLMLTPLVHEWSCLLLAAGAWQSSVARAADALVCPHTLLLSLVESFRLPYSFRPFSGRKLYEGRSNARKDREKRIYVSTVSI